MNNEEKIIELISGLKEDIGQLKKDMDERFTAVDKRFDDLESRVTKIEVVQENKTNAKLDLLFEGQKTIQNQIKHLSVVDALQADVATLKSAVQYLSSELEKIKKAM